MWRAGRGLPAQLSLLEAHVCPSVPRPPARRVGVEWGGGEHPRPPPLPLLQPQPPPLSQEEGRAGERTARIGFTSELTPRLGRRLPRTAQLPVSQRGRSSWPRGNSDPRPQGQGWGRRMQRSKLGSMCPSGTNLGLGAAGAGIPQPGDHRVLSLLIILEERWLHPAGRNGFHLFLVEFVSRAAAIAEA